MKKLLLSVITMYCVFFFGSVLAAECTGNSWQPTFVRHDAVNPTVYYFTGFKFAPMSSPDEAQRTCQAQGVRNVINGQTCAQRSWGGFGCGCNITPSRNTTCAAFQDFLRREGKIR